MASDQLKREIAEFRKTASCLPRDRITWLGEDVFCWHPDTSGVIPIPKGCQYGAAVMALTHGNELAGIAVVNRVLRLLHAGVLHCRFPVVLSLNNLLAAQSDTRFVHEDLNRCYGMVDNPQNNHERQRIKILEPILQQSLYSLDIHQTQVPLPMPGVFWPALDDDAAIAMIQEVDPEGTIVATPPTAAERVPLGVSADNAMYQQQKIGITVELGYRGFDAYQIAAGTQIVLQFLAVVSRQLLNPEASVIPSFTGIRYHTVGALPAVAGAKLRDDLRTFTAVTKGEEIGRYGDGTPILAPQDCQLLFPKVGAVAQVSSKDPLTRFIVGSSR